MFRILKETKDLALIVLFNENESNPRDNVQFVVCEDLQEERYGISYNNGIYYNDIFKAIEKFRNKAKKGI